MTELVYTKEHGSFYLYQIEDNGSRTLVSMSDEIAVLIDPELGTLQKHGNPELVRKRHAMLLEQGGDIAADWVLIASNGWDPDILTRMINCSGYAGIWYEQQQKASLATGSAPALAEPQPL